MIESLQELDEKLQKHKSKLFVFQGDNVEVSEINENLAISEIIFNQDYTPYAKKRDEKLSFCDNNKSNVI